MDEHPGVQRMRDYVAAFDGGDLDALADFYHDDIVWHVAGNHPLAGDYHGKEALFDYFGKVRGMTSGTLKIEPECIMATDGRTAVFTRVTAEREGRSIDVVLAQAFESGPDGRWTEYWAMADRQPELDAFWS